ncbi:MAG: DUF5675 family protein [Bacteroidota bacterium]
MEIQLKRLRNNGDTTIGRLTVGPIVSHSLEDEPREVKVKGETRIPAGRYEIKERQVLSGLTKKYRARFPWFRWHLELQNVLNFQYVYIHIGNHDGHTDACILTGYQQGNWKIWESTQAFKDQYFFIVGALELGERVFITIEDES